jgi:hypothetical protein
MDSYNDFMNPYIPPTETEDRQPNRSSADQIHEWVAIACFLTWITSSIWLD